VVHGRDVPVPVVVEVLQRMVPVRLTLVPAPPADPSLLERHARLDDAVTAVLRHRRRFDDVRARAVLGERGQETDVNLNYLLSGLDLSGADGARPAAPTPRLPLASGGLGAAPYHISRSAQGLGVVARAAPAPAILRSHPDVLSGGAAVPEFLYPALSGTRFSTGSGGIPAVCMTVLPHLTGDPDQAFDELSAEIPAWPDQSAAQHCTRLFAWLAARFGGTVAVERSGFSMGSVPWLSQNFPGARFVHLHRNGPDSAVSMSRHPGFRLLLVFLNPWARSTCAL
jgi:hypothetical protein